MASSVESPEAGQVLDVVAAYDAAENRPLYVYRPEAKTLGVVGFKARDSYDARILHIAVDRFAQRRRIGRLMVEASIAELGFETLRAETDSDAVGFYSACGFKVWSLGEKYPGVERFSSSQRGFNLWCIQATWKHRAILFTCISARFEGVLTSNCVTGARSFNAGSLEDLHMESDGLER